MGVPAPKNNIADLKAGGAVTPEWLSWLQDLADAVNPSLPPPPIKPPASGGGSGGGGITIVNNYGSGTPDRIPKWLAAQSLGDSILRESGDTLIVAGDITARRFSGTLPSHHATHEAGGGDAIKLDDLALPDDVLDLNATTGRHGLLPKLSGSGTEFLSGLGTWLTVSGGGAHHATHETGGTDAIVALSAAVLTSGTLVDARLSSNVPLKNAANIFTDSQTVSLATPKIKLIDTAQGTDLKQFQIGNSSQSFKVIAANDAESVLTTLLTLLRNGNLAIVGTFACSSGGIAADSLQTSGTWTPIIGGAGGQSGQTYGTQVGYWIKVGDFVNVMFNASFTAKGTITGALQIKGLPHTIANLSNHYPPANMSYWQGLGLALVHLTAFGTPGTTVLSVYGAAAAVTGLSAGDTSWVTNTTQMIGSFQYRTN